VYYTVIKHEGHLRTRGKCRKHEPRASVLCVSRVFSNVQSVLPQCNTRLRLLHLLYDIEVMWRKAIKHAFPMFYTLTKRGFSTNQSAHRVLSILQQELKHTCTTTVLLIMAASTLRRRNLKTVISLWKRIKCFWFSQRRRNLKTQQSPVILGEIKLRFQIPAA